VDGGREGDLTTAKKRRPFVGRRKQKADSEKMSLMAGEMDEEP
jgi:hypothetical protein